MPSLHTLHDSPDEVATLYLLRHTSSRVTPRSGRPAAAAPGSSPGSARPSQARQLPAGRPQLQQLRSALPRHLGPAMSPAPPPRWSLKTPSNRHDCRQPRGTEEHLATSYHRPGTAAGPAAASPQTRLPHAPTDRRQERQPPPPPPTPQARPPFTHTPGKSQAQPPPRWRSPWYCRSKSTSRKGKAEPSRPAEAAGDTISADPPDDPGGSAGSPCRRLQLLRGGSWVPLIGRAARPPPARPERGSGAGAAAAQRRDPPRRGAGRGGGGLGRSAPARPGRERRWSRGAAGTARARGRRVAAGPAAGARSGASACGVQQKAKHAARPPGAAFYLMSLLSPLS